MNTTAPTKADPRTFSICHGERSYVSSDYHLKAHTLHVREWGLEVIADSGEITGYPWANVREFTIGHTQS